MMRVLISVQKDNSCSQIGESEIAPLCCHFFKRCKTTEQPFRAAIGLNGYTQTKALNP